MPGATALIVVVAVLVTVDVLLVDQRRWTVVVAVIGTATVLAISRRAGMSAADLGLSRARWRPGLWWGGVVSALVVAAYAIAATLPMLDSSFDDDRTPVALGDVLLKVLVIIPLRTVVLEEIAFRGVLWGMVDRVRGPRWATACSAAAFGLWHVPITFVVLRTNDALARFADTWWGVALVLVGVVVGTAVAGVLLAELRRRSGSLLAPALVHWTANATGTVIGFLAR